MSEKMINDMIQRMEELKEGKYGKVEDLTFHRIMLHIFDIAKQYAVDPKELINFSSPRSDLSYEEFKVMSELNK